MKQMMSRKKQMLANSGLFSLSLGAAILAAGSVALGAIPKAGRITDDTAIYQSLSEIRVAKQKDLNFDRDIARLARLEGRYQENLPSVLNDPRVAKPMERIAKKQYRYRQQ